MSQRAGPGAVVKKRGHQHHPRNVGGRRRCDPGHKSPPEQRRQRPNLKTPAAVAVTLTADAHAPSVIKSACVPATDVIDLTTCDDDPDGEGTASKDMSLVFRPAAEGSSQSDQESEDPEIEELSRLRCTSERAEVVAERETRRRRRCADYPGLAFGSSIFSSDTLMKFSIIRNELHNIMNTQLKRVRRSVYFIFRDVPGASTRWVRDVSRS